MNKVVINKKTSILNDNLNVVNDSYIIICDDVQSETCTFNIMDCKAIIVDSSSIKNKKYIIEGATATIIDLTNECSQRELILNNKNSIVEYNIIDMTDKSSIVTIKNKNCDKGETDLNIGAVSYRNADKEYHISTANCDEYTNCHINCFGIAKDTSKLIYNISSIINKGAKKSILKQDSNILLFDEMSYGENKPSLIIEENDVKASHGSTIGKIEDETLFYMCSRGLSKNDAYNLICLGRMNYLINKIDNVEIKETLIKNFKERMSYND